MNQAPDRILKGCVCRQVTGNYRSLVIFHIVVCIERQAGSRNACLGSLYAAIFYGHLRRAGCIGLEDQRLFGNGEIPCRNIIYEVEGKGTVPVIRARIRAVCRIVAEIDSHVGYIHIFIVVRIEVSDRLRRNRTGIVIIQYKTETSTTPFS